MEYDITWLDMKVPVGNDQLLPSIGTIAIAADVGMEEVGVRDQPGPGVKRKFYCGSAF